MSGLPDPVDPLAYPDWLDELIESQPREDEVATQASRVDLVTDAIGTPSAAAGADISTFEGLNALGVASAILAQYRGSPTVTRGGRVVDAALGGVFDILMGKTAVGPVLDALAGNPVGHTLSALSSGIATSIEGAASGRRQSMNRYQAETEAMRYGSGGRLVGRLFRRRD